MSVVIGDPFSKLWSNHGWYSWTLFTKSGRPKCKCWLKLWWLSHNSFFVESLGREIWNLGPLLTPVGSCCWNHKRRHLSRVMIVERSHVCGKDEPSQMRSCKWKHQQPTASDRGCQSKWADDQTYWRDQITLSPKLIDKWISSKRAMIHSITGDVNGWTKTIKIVS